MVKPLLLAPTHHGRARLWTRRLHVSKGVRDLLGPLSWRRQSVGALQCLPSLATTRTRMAWPWSTGSTLCSTASILTVMSTFHRMMCSIDFDGNDNFQEFERTIGVESTVIDISSTWFSVLSMYAILFLFLFVCISISICLFYFYYYQRHMFNLIENDMTH